MPRFSLRLPYLIYLAIGAMLLGVLVAPAFYEVAPDDAPVTSSVTDAESTDHHIHERLDVPRSGAPEVAMTVTPDALGGWNVTIDVKNFTFTPDAVNGENTPNTGHAHLFVDGKKVARLYGPHFHLPELVPGQREIVVALNSNDHSIYVVDGAPVEARATVMQAETSDPSG